jgi:ATP-dependent protease HslVU (ClpYQ) peptidase subunit
MTCIIGYIEKGEAYIGGDSAGVAGLGLSIRKDPKVFKIGDRFLIGFTTSFRMGQLLMTKLNPPEQNSKQTDYQYMVTTFIDEVIKVFRENGYLIKDKEVVSGGTFIVAYNSQLYHIGSDFQVGQHYADFICCGCGDDIASGAMSILTGLKMKPEEKVTRALKTASSYSAGVHPPFNIIKL